MMKIIETRSGQWKLVCMYIYTQFFANMYPKTHLSTPYFLNSKASRPSSSPFADIINPRNVVCILFWDNFRG